MRSATHRFIAPLFAWIPDISGAPARRQATIGIVASILLHLLLLFIIALLAGLLPERLTRLMTARPKVEEIELIVLPPPPREEPAPALPLEANPQRAFLDSRGLAEASEAAKNAIIESDKNMKAASEMPATGDAPLPSQEGVDRPAPNFTTQEDTLGAAAKPLDLQQVKPQPMETAKAEPSPPALYKPQPIPKAAIDPVTQEPARDQPMPEPAKMTPSTLPEVAEMNALAQRALEKLRQVTQPNEDDIALSAAKPMVTPPKEMMEPPIERPRPVPIPQPKPAATPKLVQPGKMAMLTTPPPRPASSGYQPQLQKTRIEGSISNRGKAAVDAESTPLARYKKQVNDAIGSRWYYYIRGKMDLIAAGSVHMSFSINDKGQAVSVRIDANTSNQSLADVCERAIREAEIEPPPPDLIAPMKDGRLDYSLTFTFYNL
jgi:outer membrane biosynthesis protein TonB